MGLEFLARVRRGSLGLGAIASLAAASYRSPVDGLALALGTLWSIVNLVLLERLVTAVTGPDRGTVAALRRAGFAIGGTLALFGAGGVLLLRLPPVALLAGFLVPFGVMVLKAASLLTLDSRAWRTLTSSRWRAAALVAGILVAAWWLVPARVMSQAPAPASHATAASAQAVPPTAAAPSHAEPVAEGEESASKGPEKFPNVITVLARANPHAGWAHFLHHYEVVVFSLFVALLLCVVAFLASRNPQLIPGPLQNVVEMLVEWLYNFVVGILGEKHGRRYVPLLGSLFIYILAMNLFGLIPFMDSPTSNLNVTVALAILVFLIAQAIGFRELGLVGYVDHMMGQPRTVIGWLLVPLMLPIHVMGELAKPISLSCRLFGNIFGEDMLLVAFASLGVTTLAFTHLPFGLPLQLPFLFLALLTSTLQALVFTVLSTIYFLLMLPHDEHEHEGEAQPAH